MAYRVAGPQRQPVRLPMDVWVLLPAAYLLLGFLCLLYVVPAFHSTTSHEQGVYGAALIASATGVLLLLTAATYPSLVRVFSARGGRRLLLPRLIFAGRVALTLGVVLTVDGVIHRVAGEVMGYIAALGVAGLIAMSAPKTGTDDEV